MPFIIVSLSKYGGTFFLFKLKFLFIVAEEALRCPPAVSGAQLAALLGAEDAFCCQIMEEAP